MKKELVETQTPTALKSQQLQTPKLGGCVGVFFNFFDWNKRLQGSRIFSKRLPAERPSRGVKPGGDEKRTAAKLLLIADESRTSSPSRNGGLHEQRGLSPPATNAGGAAVVSPPKRVPGVVARLMGLESLPSSTPTAPRASFDGKAAQSTSRQDNAYEGLLSPRGPHELRSFRQDGGDQFSKAGAPDRGLSEVRKSPGRAKASPLPVRRLAVGDTVLPAAMGKKASALNEGVRKSPKKRAPQNRGMHHGDRRHPLPSAAAASEPEAASGIRSAGQLAKVASEDPKQMMSKMAASSRRPILLPSKNHNKVSSPNRSPTKMGSKSATILLEAAQKILEPNIVKGRTSAGRPSPVKGPLQDTNPVHTISAGGRRALDFRGAFPADAGVASQDDVPEGFDEDSVSGVSREYWDSLAVEHDDGAASDGSKKRAGYSSPGHQLHTVVTLRPTSVSFKSGIDRLSYPMVHDNEEDEDEEEELKPQELASRGRHLNPSPPLSRFGAGSPGGSFRQQDRETDFESVLSRYQGSPTQEIGLGKKKEMFGKHDQLGKLTPEQKSELVRSFSVTEQPQPLHRSGSVKEKVSRASSKMGSLLRSKSAREDKKLLGQAQFLEGEAVQQDQTKGSSDAQVKVKPSPRSKSSSRSLKGSAAGALPTSEEVVHEKKASAGFRAMKALRGKSDRKQERDLSPPSSRVFPAAGPSGAEDSPGSAQGSEPESSASKSSGGLLSYSRLFRARKDKDADENKAIGEAQNPKKNDSYSIKSLLRRKPTSPESPVVLRRGSKKIQADKPSTGQVMSMSPDIDDIFGRGSWGSSFDSTSGKLPLGCLVSELADVLETKEDATTKPGQGASEVHFSPRKPLSVSNSLSTTPTKVRPELQEDGKTSWRRDDLFDDKTVDEDYERRKAQARLTRALQRGAVTQFRGDGHWCERATGEEDPEEMFASYVAARMNETMEQHDMFWRRALSESEEPGESKSESPLNDYLLKRVKQLNNREYGSDPGSLKDAITSSTISPSKCKQTLDSLPPTSTGKYDLGSSPVPRVFITEGDSREQACEEAACTDDSGQPSPVSTLEAPFEDESSQDGISQEGLSPKAVVQVEDGMEVENASLPGGILRPEVGFTSIQESQDEQDLPRPSSSCEQTTVRAVDTANIMEAILDLSRIRQIDLREIGMQEPTATSKEEDEDEAYITDILGRADFLHRAPTWHSPRLPIDPDLFTQLENQDRGCSEADQCREDGCGTNSRNETTTASSKLDPSQWLDRKLFFDCVNEALYVRLRKYVEDEPWCMKQVLSVRPQPIGKELVKLVHGQVSQWRNMDVEPVDALIVYDMGHGDGLWTNFVQEVSEIGLEIERHILRTMIEELVIDTLGSIPTTLCV